MALSHLARFIQCALRPHRRFLPSRFIPLGKCGAGCDAGAEPPQKVLLSVSAAVLAVTRQTRCPGDKRRHKNPLGLAFPLPPFSCHCPPHTTKHPLDPKTIATSTMATAQRLETVRRIQTVMATAYSTLGAWYVLITPRYIGQLQDKQQ